MSNVFIMTAICYYKMTGARGIRPRDPCGRGQARRAAAPAEGAALQGLILLDQIRAIDKARLISKLGVLNKKTLDATLQTLQEVFAS
jgi:mRNA-degrading endonuclease toxin of MazEF toxin-antitoxin module